MEERLQKILAQAGIASRRKSEELIVAGRVKVNGKVVRELGVKVDPAKDAIEVNGKPIEKERNVYVLLNKPVGYITTMEDQFDRPKVIDIVKDIPERLHSIGRLDYDTEGLLILTNDGELTHALTHPRHNVDKVYEVTVKGPISTEALLALQKGVRLDDGITAPAKTELISRKSNISILKVAIHEGRNRQVRRMMDAVGFPVLKLKRTQIGTLTLGELKPGEYRHLSKKEVELLKKTDKTTRY